MNDTSCGPNLTPQSPEAEIAVLGAFLIAPTHVSDLGMTRLSEDHFFQHKHRLIFSVLKAMSLRGEPVNLVTVTTRLKDTGELDEAGGADYIRTLTGSPATMSRMESNLRILHEKHQLRRLIDVAHDTIRLAGQAEGKFFKISDRAQCEIWKIYDANLEGPEVRPTRLLADKMVKRVTEWHAHGGKLPGLSWGFSALDQLTFGLQNGAMIVIAGRPGVGKTALALNIAEKLVTGEAKTPVGIMSLELTAQQLILRMGSSHARIDAMELLYRSGSKADLDTFCSAIRLIGECPLHIDDTGHLDMEQVRAIALQMVAPHQIRLLIVDDIQCLTANDPNPSESREHEMARIFSDLKALERELDIPLIVLSQLDRQSEKRDSGKPRITDLQASDAMERHADIVCLLSREDAYEESTGLTKESVLVDVRVAKNRNGPTGSAKLVFFPKHSRFEEVDELKRSSP